MTTQFEIVTAPYEDTEQERQENLSKNLANGVANQPSPPNVPSSFKEGSDSQHGEDPAAVDNNDNSQERSEFSKQWKGVKFPRGEVEELLKQEPSCDRCLKLNIPCNIVKENLTCKECRTKKVVCPRKFNNTVRTLAKKLGESEDGVRSKHARLMAPSTHKGKGKKGDGDVAKGKALAKKDEALQLVNGEAKGNSKEQEGLPKIVIPGGHGGQSNEIEGEALFKRSNSHTLLDNDDTANEEALRMDVDIPEVSKPQSRSHPQVLHASGNQVTNEDENALQVLAGAASSPQSRISDLQGLDVNNNQKAGDEIPTSEMAVDVPERSQLQRSHLQLLHADDTPTSDAGETSLQMHVDDPSLGPESSRLRSQIPDTPLELEHKIWDDLSRGGLYEQLEAYEARHLLSRQLLDDVTANATNQLKKARSEIQQALHQRLEAESELSELRRKMEALAEERNEALNEAQRSKELLQEVQAAQLEVQQVEDQRLEAESDLFELRRKVEAPAGEKVEALKEGHQLGDFLQEAQDPKEFAPSDGCTAQDQGHDNQVSDRYRPSPASSLGEQPNLQNENQSEITMLRAVIATHDQLFKQERNQRKELEDEVAFLRSKPSKAILYPCLLEEYRSFAREVLVTSYALEVVEGSVSRDTDFQCEGFHKLICGLFEASTSAENRIKTMKHGKYRVVSFIEPDDADYNKRKQSSSPSMQKGGEKRKERDDDDHESRAGSMYFPD